MTDNQLRYVYVSYNNPKNVTHTSEHGSDTCPFYLPLTFFPVLMRSLQLSQYHFTAERVSQSGLDSRIHPEPGGDLLLDGGAALRPTQSK